MWNGYANCGLIEKHANCGYLRSMLILFQQTKPLTEGKNMDKDWPIEADKIDSPINLDTNEALMHSSYSENNPV